MRTRAAAQRDIGRPVVRKLDTSPFRSDVPNTADMNYCVSLVRVATDHTICELCALRAPKRPEHDHLASLALGHQEASMDHTLMSQKEDSLVEIIHHFSMGNINNEVSV